MTPLDSSKRIGPRYDQRVVMILDSEVQRLATLHAESDSPAVREPLFARAKYIVAYRGQR